MSVTAEALDQAYVPPAPAPAPSPVQPIGACLGNPDAMERGARDWARRWNLIDSAGRLHCAACRKVIEWHVSLHCPPCRVDERMQRPDRLRRERERQMQQAQQQREEQEQSRPVQRVGGRSFRDGY